LRALFVLASPHAPVRWRTFARALAAYADDTSDESLRSPQIGRDRRIPSLPMAKPAEVASKPSIDQPSF